jgi:hypothetical protein
LLRNELCSNNLSDFALRKGLQNLNAVRTKFFKPAPQHEKSVNELFDQVIAWSSALKALR